MRLAVVTDTAASITIGSVAFDDGAMDLVDHGFPEFRTEEILVALFAGVDFDGDFAGQGDVEFVIDLNNFFGSDFPGEIARGFHVCSFQCFRGLVYCRDGSTIIIKIMILPIE